MFYRTVKYVQIRENYKRTISFVSTETSDLLSYFLPVSVFLKHFSSNTYFDRLRERIWRYLSNIKSNKTGNILKTKKKASVQSAKTAWYYTGALQNFYTYAIFAKVFAHPIR